ncbi:MAG: CDP-alcohol phosphatidyltransferase family protein, partial [Candidatus Midichloria mitochondrii]|nr:CDP-alcohol phosphatidyltransferase family protein [Candidatus Midichloria mitochondrii]
LIPILVTSFYLEGNAARYVATGIFIFASITDYFDGLLARLWKTETSFGRMLDPIADKMLVISTLVMLVHKNMAPVLPI